MQVMKLKTFLKKPLKLLKMKHGKKRATGDLNIGNDPHQNLVEPSENWHMIFIPFDCHTNAKDKSNSQSLKKAIS